VRAGERALAVGYLAYYTSFGVYMPFWSAHLAQLGLSASAIGMALAMYNAARIIAPLGGGWLLDHARDRRALLWVLSGGALVAAALTAYARSPVWIGVTLALYSLPVTALMPMYDAVALERLGSAHERYGRLRLFGSIGFVLAAVGLGALVGRVGDDLIPVALILSQALGLAAFLALPPLGPGARGVAGRAAFGVGVSRPLAWLLLIAFLQVAGYGAFNGFYTLYLRGFGYSAAAISGYWSLGVLAEIGLFALAPMLLRRVAPVPLLRVALALTVVRWVLIAYAPRSALLMVVAQVLHAAGFGAFQAVTVLLAARYLPAGAGGRAQALLAAAGWGVGGIVGSVLAGVVWERFGPSSAFAAGAVLSSLAWGCAYALPRTLESVTGARDRPGEAGHSPGRGP